MKPKFKDNMRSSLEVLVKFLLQGSKVDAKYEDTVLKYEQPAQSRRYNPDFRLPKGTLSANSPEVFLEVKGQLTSQDRKKMKLVKEQHPEKTIIMIFGRAANRLNKKSDTTYSNWCDKYGILWCDVKDLQEGDVKKCLLSLMKKQVSGTSKTRRQRKSRTLFGLARKSSLKVSEAA